MSTNRMHSINPTAGSADRRSATRLAATCLALLVPALARAGVEFVTRTSDCTNKVDTIGDGKDLFIVADANVQFEVFGNSIDLVNPTTGFRIATDSGAGNVTARIVSRHGGAENSGRGCGLVGSAVVEVDSPVGLTSNVQRSLFFKMPLGDESRLQMTIKPYPTFTLVWNPPNASIDCIVKTGSFQLLQQNLLAELHLPPGHRQDQTTCASPVLTAKLSQTDVGEIDVAKNIAFTATGLPAFLSLSPTGNQTSALLFRTLTFNISTPGIRALTATSTSTITVHSPNPARTATLQLRVIPQAANGFTATARCNPASFNVGDLTDCSITLATAPTGAGQPITWRLTTATCFVQAIATAPYDPNAAFQVFTFPAGQTTANIRVRSKAGAGCSDLDGVTHIFEAWIGNFRVDPQVTTPTSGPSYTKTSISVKQVL